MRILMFWVILTAMLACQNTISPEQQTLTTALETYAAKPSEDAAAQVLTGFDAYLQARGYTDPATPELLLQMASFAKGRNDARQTFEFYKSYLVQYPDRPDAADRLADAISTAASLQSTEWMDVLYASFAARYPQDPRSAGMKDMVSNKSITPDSLIRHVGTTMFNDSTFRLNEDRARLYIDLCEAGVMANPAIPNGPEFLHRGAETARTLRDIPRAIRLYDWIITRYPDHPRAPVSMFLKAFTYDNELKDFAKAGTLYHEFLTQYPNNEYAESARFLLENLGKSEQELIKILEKNKEEVQ